MTMTSAGDARRPERARINWWRVSWRAAQVVGVVVLMAIVSWSGLFMRGHWSCYHPMDAAHAVSIVVLVFSGFGAVIGCFFGVVFFVKEAIPAWRRKAGL